MQASTQLHQGLTVGGIGLPTRPLFVQLWEQLIGFFEEHLAQLVINHRLLDYRDFKL
ncbi:hypothetical protein D3C76_1791880 [compost metagenome]